MKPTTERNERGTRSLQKLSRRLVVAAAIILAGAGSALAEPTAADKDAARALMSQGDKAFAAKDYQGALKAYVAAHGIINVPTTGIEVAKAQEAVGLLVEARDTLLQVSRYPQKADEPQAFQKARDQAKDLAPKIAARISSATIVVSGLTGDAVPNVTIDSVVVPPGALLVPRKVNPGKHTAVARASGYTEATKEFSVKESESTEVRLELSPSGAAVAPQPIPAGGTEGVGAAGAKPSGKGSAAGAPAASSATGKKTSPLVYAGFGVGGVGVVAGSITGLLAFSKASSAKSVCNGNLCPPEAQNDIDSSKTMGTVSTISFAVGLVGIGVGVYGLMTQQKATEQTASAPTAFRWSPTLGVGTVGVQGQF